MPQRRRQEIMLPDDAYAVAWRAVGQ